MSEFLNWVHEYFIVIDSEPIEITRREHPLSSTPVPEPEQSTASTVVRPFFNVPCRGGCKEFSKSGSNAYIDMRSCKKCGTVTKTKEEKQVVDPTPCLHGVTEENQQT